MAVPVVGQFRCGGNRWALCALLHNDNGKFAGVGRRLAARFVAAAGLVNLLDLLDQVLLSAVCYRENL